MKNKSIILLVFIITMVSSAVYGQVTLVVDDNRTINQVVKSLEGEGVEISNIRSNIDESMADRPVAFFDDILGVMGIDKGLIMTNGLAKNAVGPNNAEDITHSGFYGDADDDLKGLIDEELFDVVIIEFDIVGTFDQLSFNYVFGSEEYLEYVNKGFNDVFGFFISGPGIDGTQNLAVVGDNNPVSVNSINPKSNSNLYVSNGAGQNPALNSYVQYDGYTKELIAEIDIIPCETYRIKLAIADGGDDVLDSGVFIEQESFTTTSSFSVDVSYEHEEYDFGIEECNKGFFTITRSDDADLGKREILDYTLTGSAINGLDFTRISLPEVVFEPGQKTVVIEIDPLQDNIEEEEEQVTLTLIISECDRIKSTLEATMPIRDEFKYEIPDQKSCEGVEVTLNEDAPSKFSFKWEDSDLLSCTDCPSPKVAATAEPQTFTVDVEDNVTGCKTTSTVTVSADLVKAFFKYSANDNYTSIDAFFDNLSEGADRYEWQFGDGNTSAEFEPVHVYSIEDFFKEAEFTIKLTAFADELGCMDMYDTTIVINEPFFIPNIITPGNADGLNDNFEIKGIRRSTWKLEIFNRWGTMVYENDNYNQEWDSNGLSDGVYYYQLTNPKGDRKFKGWVQTFNSNEGSH